MSQDYAFLKFNPDISGTSEDEYHKKEVVVGSIGQAVRQTSGFKGTARVTQFTDFSFTKSGDAASPIMFKACAEKTKYPTVVCTIVAGDEEVYKVTLEDCHFTNCSLNFSAGDEAPIENYSLGYRRIKWEKGEVKGDWDLDKDAPCG